MIISLVTRLALVLSRNLSPLRTYCNPEEPRGDVVNIVRVRKGRGCLTENLK